MVEDHPVGHARQVTAEWMVRCDLGMHGQQHGKLIPDGVQQAYWPRRHGILQESLRQPISMIFRSVPACCLLPVAENILEFIDERQYDGGVFGVDVDLCDAVVVTAEIGCSLRVGV